MQALSQSQWFQRNCAPSTSKNNTAVAMLEEAAKAKNGLQMTGTTTATLVVPEEALASQRMFVVVQAS